MKQTYIRTYSTFGKNTPMEFFKTGFYEEKQYDVLKCLQHLSCQRSSLMKIYSIVDGEERQINSRVIDKFSFDVFAYKWIRALCDGEVVMSLEYTSRIENIIEYFTRRLTALKSFLLNYIVSSSGKAFEVKYVIPSDFSMICRPSQRTISYTSVPFCIDDIDELIEALNSKTSIGRPLDVITSEASRIALAEMNDICKSISKWRNDACRAPMQEITDATKWFSEKDVDEYIKKHLPSIYERITNFMNSMSGMFHESPEILKFYFHKALLSSFFSYAI